MPSGTQAAIAALRPSLAELGFKKRAGQVFTLNLTDDVLGWLGLNTASRYRQRGEAEVNPVVGVRHQAVERVVAELRGVEFHAYQPPTVSAPIGYLLPEHRYAAWVLGGEECSAEAANLVAAVAGPGVGFMRSHLELPAIRAAAEAGLGHQLEYRLPVVLALVGDRDAARAALCRSLHELGDRHDLAAQQFRQFAEAFGRWEARGA